MDASNLRRKPESGSVSGIILGAFRVHEFNLLQGGSPDVRDHLQDESVREGGYQRVDPTQPWKGEDEER